jgi:hypothetical protein
VAVDPYRCVSLNVSGHNSGRTASKRGIYRLHVAGMMSAMMMIFRPSLFPACTVSSNVNLLCGQRNRSLSTLSVGSYGAGDDGGNRSSQYGGATPFTARSGVSPTRSSARQPVGSPVSRFFKESLSPVDSNQQFAFNIDENQAGDEMMARPSPDSQQSEESGGLTLSSAVRAQLPPKYSRPPSSLSPTRTSSMHRQAVENAAQASASLSPRRPSTALPRAQSSASDLTEESPSPKRVAYTLERARSESVLNLSRNGQQTPCAGPEQLPVSDAASEALHIDVESHYGDTDVGITLSPRVAVATAGNSPVSMVGLSAKFIPETKPPVSLVMASTSPTMIAPQSPTPAFPSRAEIGTNTSQPSLTDIGVATSRTVSPKLEDVLESLTYSDTGTGSRPVLSTAEAGVGTSQRTTPRSVASSVIRVGIDAETQVDHHEPPVVATYSLESKLPQPQYDVGVTAAENSQLPGVATPASSGVADKPVATRPSGIRKNSTSITRPSRPHRSVSFSNSLRSSSEERRSRRDSEITIRHVQHTATVSHSMQMSTTSVTIPEHMLKQVRSSMSGLRQRQSDGHEASEMVGCFSFHGVAGWIIFF